MLAEGKFVSGETFEAGIVPDNHRTLRSHSNITDTMARCPIIEDSLVPYDRFKQRVIMQGMGVPTCSRERFRVECGVGTSSHHLTAS